MAILGNKLSKEKVCKYIRKCGHFTETYETGWFRTKLEWMKDGENFSDTIFRIKTKYLVVPVGYRLSDDGCIDIDWDSKNQITYNAIPEEALYKLLDYYIDEYEKLIEPAKLMYKAYMEKQKLEKIDKDFK
jgi:hypothetical protein